MNSDDIEVFLGLDVGKTDHWPCALTHDGKRIWNKTLPNDEPKLVALYRDLQAYGTVLVIADQSAIIGALAVVVAQEMPRPIRRMHSLSLM